MHAQTWCRSEHAGGFTAGQKNCGKSGLDHWDSGPWAAGPLWAKGRWALAFVLLGRRPAFSKTQLSSIQSFVEMNFTWNLTEREHLPLHYDSAEEMGQLVCFQCVFLASSGIGPESSV